MKLYLDAEGAELGHVLPVPPALASLLISWSTSLYYELQANRILVQEYISEQFKIFSWRLWVNESITLYPTAVEPTVALQFMLQGTIPCELAGYGEKILKEHFSELFYVPPHSNQAHFSPGTYHTLHIELSPLYLLELAKTDAPIRLLLSRMEQGSDEGGFLAPVYLQYISIYHLKQLQFTAPNTGLHLLHLQQHIYALLIEYLGQLQMQESFIKVTASPHELRVLRLKEHILKVPNVNSQTISKLAQWTGMSSTTLKSAFKSKVGVSLSAFVRSQALSKGHFLLTSTSLSIEEIGWEIGYSSLGSFRRAFTRQFGYTPESIRPG